MMLLCHLPRGAKRPLGPVGRPASACVELAVIATFLATIMMGMMEVTRAIQVKNYLTDAARSGCRRAIVPGTANSTVTANINSVLTSNGLTSSDATITIKVNGTVADVSTAVKYDQISVTISIPIAKISWVQLSIFSSTSVGSETVVMMRY